MQADFWHNRWTSDKIGWHESQVNPVLVAHLPALGIPQGSRVFLPLCGKTVDIDWLLSQGYSVAGAELSPLAVAQLFERLGVAPVRVRVGELEHLKSHGLDIYCGDVCMLAAAVLGVVDAVYDRAALIALPPDMRPRYASHVATLTNDAPQLLVTVEYDPAQMEGPPFAVGGDEVRRLYKTAGRNVRPMLLDSHPVPGGLRGGCPATESVWLISR